MVYTPLSHLQPPHSHYINAPFSLNNASLWKTCYIFTSTTSDQKAKKQSWMEFGRKKEAAQLLEEKSPHEHHRRSLWL